MSEIPSTLNEMVVFLGAVRDGGWLVLCATFAVAAAFLVLDRPAKEPAIEHGETLPERKAA